MSFLWDSLYSVFARTRNCLVDPPGEENPENPELAITGEGRGATVGLLSDIVRVTVSATHLTQIPVPYMLADFLAPTPSEVSFIWMSLTHRRSQDFRYGVHFIFTLKADDFIFVHTLLCRLHITIVCRGRTIVSATAWVYFMLIAFHCMKLNVSK